MELSVTNLWLISGVIMLAAEAFGISGVGLMFAGLGCLSTGAMLNLGLIALDARLMQFLVFFMSTAIWTIVLWKPMRRFYSKQNKFNSILKV